MIHGWRFRISAISIFIIFLAELAVPQQVRAASLARSVSAPSDDSAGTCAAWYEKMRSFLKPKESKPAPEIRSKPRHSSPDLAIIARSTRENQEVLEYPVADIPFESFVNPIETGFLDDSVGNAYHQTYRAQYSGSEVFIKVSQIREGTQRGDSRTLANLLNEIEWTKRLDQWGVGPKYYGLSKKKSRGAIVTEFVEGIHVGAPGKPFPPGFAPTEELIESLQNIAAVIQREGVYAKDLQFRMTAKRAYIVDPEFYRAATEPAQIQQSLDEIQQHISQIRSMLRKP